MNPPDESKNNRDHIEPQPDCVQNSSQDHSHESDSSNDSTKPAHLKNESGSEQILISAKTSNTNQPEEVSQLSAAKKPFFGKNFLILVFVIFLFLLLCLGFYLRSYLALIEILTLCGVVFVFLISNPFSRPLNFYDDRAESIVKQELTGKREIQSQTAETEKDKAFFDFMREKNLNFSDNTNSSDNHSSSSLGDHQKLKPDNKPSKAILIPVALLGAPLLFVFLAYNNMSMETSTIISVAFMVLISSMALLYDDTWTNSAILPEFLWALIVIISLSLLPFLAFFITFYSVCRSMGFFGQ